MSCVLNFVVCVLCVSGQVQKNQKRAAKVWLDEYYFLFYKYHPEVRGHREGQISSRIRLRYEQLSCMPFQWYVEKFRTAFDRNNLLDHNFFHIQHSQTGKITREGLPRGGGGRARKRKRKKIFISRSLSTSLNSLCLCLCVCLEVCVDIGSSRVPVRFLTRSC